MKQAEDKILQTNMTRGCSHVKCIRPQVLVSFRKSSFGSCCVCQIKRSGTPLNHAICLTCGFQGCAQTKNSINHTRDHFRANPDHCIFFSLANLKLCCLICHLVYEPDLFELGKFSVRANNFYRIHSVRTSDCELVKRPTALSNLGVSCFLNSVIQSLFACEEFYDLLIKSESKLRTLVIPLSDKLNPLNIFVLKPLGSIGKSLCNLFKTMSDPQNKKIIPRVFFDLCKQHLHDFSVEMMHDSHEFLISLLNCISNEVFERVSKIISSNIKTNQEYMDAYRNAIPDFFNEEIFQGSILSEVICCECLNKSSNVEKFLDLSIPLYPTAKKSNSQKIKKLFSFKSTEKRSPIIENSIYLNGDLTYSGIKKNFFLNHIFAYRSNTKQHGPNHLPSWNEFSQSPPIERSCEFESLNLDLKQNWRDTQSCTGLNIFHEKYIIHIRNSSEDSRSCSERDVYKIKVPFMDNSNYLIKKPHLQRSNSCSQIGRMGCDDIFKVNDVSKFSMSCINDINVIEEGYLRFLSFYNDSTYTFMSRSRRYSSISLNAIQEDSEISATENQSNLKSCLNNFFSTEMFDQNNKILCQKCTTIYGANTFTVAKRRLRIVDLPKILIIHLKRFRQTVDKFSKLNKHIGFGEYLNMGEYCIRKKNVNYRLFSVIQHSGMIDEGHYTSYVRFSCSGNRWFLTNDYVIREVCLETVLNSNAYILFYRMCT